MPDNASSRDALINRQLPEMVLSDGTPSSQTSPHLLPTDLPADQRAESRFSLRGKSAIFTGGAGTLALTGARALLEHNLHHLALFDINPAQAWDHIEALRRDFPHARIIAKQVDVTNAKEVDEAVAATAEELGRIDVLCCFAGIVGCTHALDMSPNEWNRILGINTTGAFLCAQAVAKRMIEQGTGGSMVFIASISGHRVNFPQPQIGYNVSKAGVLHMTRCLAAEWARYGIRCNSISPGYMDTILNEGAGLERARSIWNGRNPMGRMGHPQELTGPLVLLASDAGSYINGADIVVDGGGTAF